MELPPNHKFNVLAWFLITDMWFEKMNDDFAGIKLRLEKLDLSEKSWWAKEDSPDPVPHCNRDFSIQPLVNVCESCAEPSSQIFNEGWMCLNEKCGQFWQMEDGAVPDDLTYHNNFLQKRQPPTGIVPDPLVPDFFAAFENEGTVAGIERLNWRGPVCPNCHQCLSRERWNGWRCDCDGGVNGPWEYMVDVDPVVKKVSPGHRAGPFGSDTIPRGSKIVGVVDNKPGTYRKATYTVPDGAGTVLHFFANPALNKRPDGADESLADLQRLARTELDLRRYPLSNAVGKSFYLISSCTAMIQSANVFLLLVDGTLTCHFAQNFVSGFYKPTICSSY